MIEDAFPGVCPYHNILSKKHQVCPYSILKLKDDESDQQSDAGEVDGLLLMHIAESVCFCCRCTSTSVQFVDSRSTKIRSILGALLQTRPGSSQSIICAQCLYVAFWHQIELCR